MQSSSVSPSERIAESRHSWLSGIEILAPPKVAAAPSQIFADSFYREANDVSIMRVAKGRGRMNHRTNGAIVNGEIVNEPRMFARSSSL